MTNPFVIGLKTNPQQFFNELDTPELQAVALACIRVLENRHREGDQDAAPGLQAIYREVGEIEL